MDWYLYSIGYLTCNLNFFATAYLLIRKSFKVKVPADPFHQNLSDFFGRKEVLYLTPLPLPNPQHLAEGLLVYKYRLVQF
jgi:hypothetical protein